MPLWKSYLGDGEPIDAAPFFRPIIDDSPVKYLPSDELKAAVHVAVTLGMPLLLTGAPGSGKTQLANYLAYRLGRQRPLIFNAKTTSVAQDLFYRYDALRHLQEANVQKASMSLASERLNVENFIEYQALGEAIILASGPNPRRPVVLIDEIDKAPRDFPNDVLDEIETMSFLIKENGRRVPGGTIDQRYRPIVVLTSNSEKNLPDAFLRRCAFFYIEPPDAAHLRAIVDARLGHNDGFFAPRQVDEAIALFMRIRDQGNLRKPPSTAEFLAWLRMLSDAKLSVDKVQALDRDAVLITCSILAKSTDDVAQIHGTLGT